jgi:hypothetical protein
MRELPSATDGVTDGDTAVAGGGAGGRDGAGRRDGADAASGGLDVLTVPVQAPGEPPVVERGPAAP